MRIWPVPTLDLTLGRSMAAREASPTRGVGVHMSDIYGRLYQKLDPKRYAGGGFDGVAWSRIELGLALEEMLEEGLVRRLMERPGEFRTPEGIYYNPDGLLFDSERIDGVVRDLVVCELKLTWMTTKDCPITSEQAENAGLTWDETVSWDGDPSAAFPPKFDKYFTQIKSYCYHLGTNHARLIVFFVNGDKRPPVPCILAWDIEFNEIELVEEWSMMVNFAKEEEML